MFGTTHWTKLDLVLFHPAVVVVVRAAFLVARSAPSVGAAVGAVGVAVVGDAPTVIGTFQAVVVKFPGIQSVTVVTHVAQEVKVSGSAHKRHALNLFVALLLASFAEKLGCVGYTILVVIAAVVTLIQNITKPDCQGMVAYFLGFALVNNLVQVFLLTIDLDMPSHDPGHDASAAVHGIHSHLDE